MYQGSYFIVNFAPQNNIKNNTTMRAIDGEKIIGVKIWKNETDWRRIEHGVFNDNNSWRYIEFKSLEAFDEFIKDLKQFKKDYLESEKRGY
jgi:hypothetical protein